MESLCQNLLLREIFGDLPEGLKVSCQVRGTERILINQKLVHWVQAKDNFLAFISGVGGLTVYNTLKKVEVFSSDFLGIVFKAWFFAETLVIITRDQQQIMVYQLFLDRIGDQVYRDFNHFLFGLDLQNNSIKLLKKLEINGIDEIDVSQELIVVKCSKIFHIISLQVKDWKIHFEGNARYTKGFILSLFNGKITMKNVRTLESHSFSPNFSRIFHMDIINSTIFAYNDKGFCSFNLHSRCYKVILKSLSKYFEIEDSGESLLVFSDSTSSLMTPEEVPIISCEEVFSVSDNKEHIFILSSFSLFLVQKNGYSVQVVLLDSPYNLVGCNENDCEFFLADDDSLTICLF